MPLYLILTILTIIHTYNHTFIHSFILHHSSRPVFLYPHRFFAQQEKTLHGGAKLRIELGPTLQQSDARFLKFYLVLFSAFFCLPSMLLDPDPVDLKSLAF
jgi:hypothetical protein